MKISIINGSPKLGNSTSQLIIEYLIPLIDSNNTLVVFDTNRTAFTENRFTNIEDSNAIVFVFPLYIDSIPAHLLKLLIALEKRQFKNSETMVYCIINNGFFEGTQNQIALGQMKIWCDAVNLSWGQGVGLGAGEMLPFLKDIPLGHGPNKNIGKALKALADNILAQKSGSELFVSPNWPRFLWRVQSSLFVWYPRAKANGLSKNCLLKQVKNK